jgi:hypothetical protein
MDKEKLIGSYSGSVTVTKTDASSFKLTPMRETLEIRGLVGGRMAVTFAPEGRTPVEVPEEEATELAKQLLTLERVRHAKLNLGVEATIVWKHYRYITTTKMNDMGADEHLVMRCTRCGAAERVNVPITAGALHDRFAPFGRVHEGCEEK